ncbi:MAG: zinc ribbon domain-containing protein, partial [Thermoguttaceae bacterium]|nr:zinc ribbon domain-containing protein [Thermoguttaceae bacterium]
MPTYEYCCDACRENVEVFQKMSEEPLEVCPKCGEKALRRLISG